MKLKDLQPGWSGVVTDIGGISPSRRRLIDMGLLPGIQISVIRKAPFGDPYLIRIRGYTLSLRKRDAKQIQVEGVQKNERCFNWKSKLRENNAF